MRRIDGRTTQGVGQSIAALIGGPEGTFVEIQAERNGVPLPTFRIRRGTVNPGAPQPDAAHADSALFASKTLQNQV